MKPAALPPEPHDEVTVDQTVGKRLNDLRIKYGFSLRELAERSRLNVNTLSLIENGKSSPSVSTLQQLARALEVPITAFFASKPITKNIVFTEADHRPTQRFGSTEMQHLGRDLTDNAVQPFVVTLQPGMSSGDQMIVHTGYEFVYCLLGSVQYTVNQQNYLLHAGDSLVFEAHLPHCWVNDSEIPSQLLLILYPADSHEKLGGQHFSNDILKKGINMKIAAITDDGVTISKHFGRARSYLVITIESGKIADKENRSKLSHDHFQGQSQHEEHHDEHHGTDQASHGRHLSMAETISDCTTLLCGGMGRGAYESMRQLNIQPLVTDLENIDEAVQAFIDGKLIDHTELLH